MIERAPETVRRPHGLVERLPSDDELITALASGVPDIAATIRTSNDLVRAHYNLSINAMRVMAFYVSQLDTKTTRDSGQFPLMRIALSHIAETFPALASSKNIYKEIELAADELFDAQVVLPINNGRGERLRLRWAPTCGKVGGHLLMRLNGDLMPYLLDLKERYTSKQLMYVIELRSPYHWRLYEIFRSYLFRGRCSLTVDEMKAMLDIDSGLYKKVGHFVSRILTPALTAIEQITDIQVTIERPRRDGKRILGWDFLIRRQAQRKLILSPKAAPLIEKMMRLGIPVKTATSFAENYEPDYLAQQLEFMTGKGSSGYVIEDPPGFLRAALEGNFAAERAEGALLEAAKQSEVARVALHHAAEARLREAKSTAEQLAPADFRRDKAMAMFDALPERKRREVRQVFADGLPTGAFGQQVATAFNAGGFENPRVAAMFRNFLVDHFAIPAPTRTELQEYIASHWDAYAPAS
ncbi:replication initiation protein [Sinimarinibacterium sp. CAU 1509]|uniref:replication initiation protein n=1 Tax=Sinimarinibacterium sp. CAU 1509 TaxID=2562283 RepID=UPI00146A1865|nr:replication initiation protein [Sinimarinibacterium sp. CAU 1509]